MPPLDKQPAGATSPDVSAAQKRVAALEADIANLRRGMVQQLTASGKLLKAVFTLDSDYFGGRFQAQESSEGKTPIRDLGVATQVIEAVAEQLQGESAFADSPMLRDCVGTLVAAVESLRNQAIEVERVGSEAVGLQPKMNIFPARTFPENNPLACLNETAAFARDVQAVFARTRDRVGALKMMLAEADRARAEAEASVPTVNPEQVSAHLSSELKSRDGEVAALRAQTLKMQEAQATEQRRMRADLAQAQEALSREADLRRADHAEARSLAAEIERLASADPGIATSDDLEITLSVLHDHLENASGIETVASSAEAVLVGWARLVTVRAESASAELAALGQQAAQPTKRLAELEAELVKARSELAKFQSLAAVADSARAAAQTKLEAREQDLKRITDERAAAQAKLEAREQDFKRITDERVAERAAWSKEREQLAAPKPVTESHTRDAASLRTQLAEVTRSLQTSEVAVRTREEALKLRDLDVKRLDDELIKARETAQQQLTDAKARSDQSVAELTKAATDKERQLTAARADLERERDQLKTRLEELRKTNETGLAQVRGEIDGLAKQLTQAHSSEKIVREEMAKSGAALSAATARVAQLERELTQLKAEREKAVSSLSQARQESQDIKRKATDLELEKTKLATSGGQAESRLKDLQQEIDRAKAVQAEAQKRTEALSTDLTQVREKLSLANAARDQALAQRSVLQDAESTLTAQRDTARSALTAITTERDRTKANLERLQAEQTALTKRLEEREAQLNARIAESTKQIGELKVTQAKLTSENERLQAEAARLVASRDAEPREGTATWSKRLTDSASLVEDARKKSSDLARKVEEQHRQLAQLEERLARSSQSETHLSERIAELERNDARLRADLSAAQGSAAPDRIAKLEADVAAERQQRQQMAKLLVESREAVMRARQALLDAGQA